MDAFFKGVDLDEDRRIGYSDLVEAVHLMEPLPYRPTSTTELVARESEIRLQLEKSKALERLYLSSYPYYIYPYYPLYYPSYYPYWRLSEMRLRESSLERLRRSRLESEERLLDMERSRRTAEALADSRQRSAERIRQIETESRIRQAQIEEDARLRELSRIRDDELRRSRERAF